MGKGLSGGFLPSIKGLMGPVAALFAVGAVVGFFKSANAEARESQKVGALTTQVIKTTGGVAKITAGQVGDLAMAISNKTGIDDEAIQHGANLLLTFKNVRNEVGKGSDIFNRATAAAADLSASGFGDLAGSSKQLGKALNDPIKGITALGRAGVTFSEGQKKQIAGFVKAGDMLSAQKIIMGEVESQVGGAAAASATAGEKLSTTWGNLKEQVGTALLPAIDTAMTAVSGFLGGVMESFKAGGIGQVFTDIGANITAALPGIQAKLGEWATAFVAWIQVAGPPMLVKLGELLMSLGTWVATVALPAIAAKLVEWGKAFVEWIVPMIPPALAKLGELLVALGNWLLTTALPAIGTKLLAWGKAFVAWIGPMIPPVLLALGGLLLKLAGWLLGTALPAIVGKLAEWALAFAKWVPGAIVDLIGKLGGLLVSLGGWILTTALPAIVKKLGEWALAFVKWVADAVSKLPAKLGELLTKITTWAGEVPGKIVSAIGDLGSLLYNKGKEIIQGLINGVGSMVGRLAGAMADAVKRGITDLLPGSPVKKGPLRVLNNGYAGGQIVKMLAGGIDSQQATLDAQLRNLVSIPRVGSLDFASSADRAGAVAGGGSGATSADIAALGDRIGAELERQARTIQTMQRQMAK